MQRPLRITEKCSMAISTSEKEVLTSVQEVYESLDTKSKFSKIIPKPLARASPCTGTMRISVCVCELPRVLFRLGSDTVLGISNVIVAWVS